MMTIEDWMGLLLFAGGLVLIVIAFLSVIDIIALISSLMAIGFSILGFILCVTGFAMARSAMGGVMSRFRRP
jgi:hypothetical protein